MADSKSALSGPYLIHDKRGKKTVRRVNFQVPNEDWDLFESLVEPGESIAVSLRRVFRAGLDTLQAEYEAHEETP